MISARIISIGTELVLGRTVDTNAAWLAAQLAELGIRAAEHLTVGDDVAAIRRAIEWACGESDIVIATGGLGPTGDDLTRQALADAMSTPLETQQDLVDRLQAFFAARNRPMPESNLAQAHVPRGAHAIENRWGTAPGLRATLGRAEVFCLPGVPNEMKAMFAHRVRPVLSDLAGGDVILETVIQTYGGGEAEIGERIADLMARGRNPEVGTTAKDAIIGIRIIAAGPRAQASRLLESDAAEIRRRLGSWVFGDNDATLEAALGSQLVSANKTIATAESCTGGLIAKRLTDVSGSSRYFLAGFVTYSDAAKQRELGVSAELLAAHGAVSEPVAAAMARGCRERTGANYTVSVTGIAGPGGGSPIKPVGLVYVGLASAAGVTARELRLGDHLSRCEIRDRTAKAAMNLVRLYLHDQPAGH